MVIVGVLAVAAWRRISGAAFKWFGVGAALWSLAVVPKGLVSSVTNPALVEWLGDRLSAHLMPAFGGAAIGRQSSFFEIGLTLAAALVWRQLAARSRRAIALGIGAGGFEALVIGAAQIASTATALAGVAGTEGVRQLVNPEQLPVLFWLVAPVERTIALLTHASSRALVLLGVASMRVRLPVAGFALFAALDSIAAGAQLAGLLRGNAVWLVEAALLPIGLVSVPILRWCRREWSAAAAAERAAEGSSGGAQAPEVVRSDARNRG